MSFTSHMRSFWRKSSDHNDQTWKVIEAIARRLWYPLDWCVRRCHDLVMTWSWWPTLRRQWPFIVVAGTTPLSLSVVDLGSAVQGNARLRGQLFVPQETVWEPVRSPLIKKHRRLQQQRGAYYRPQQSPLKLIDIAFPNARWKVNRTNIAVSTQNVWRNGQDSVPG